MLTAPKPGRIILWWAVYMECGWVKFIFGESMFSLVANASKFAFIKYVEQLKTGGVAINRLPGVYATSGKFRRKNDTKGMNFLQILKTSVRYKLD